MSFYRALAIRAGKWWAVDVPEVPGVHTQGLNLIEAAKMAREAVALTFDISVDKVEIELEAELPEEAAAAVRGFERARAARQAAEEAERTAQQEAARSLIRAGLTVRDAGAVLGVSHQRIAQLAPAGGKDRPGTKPPAKEGGTVGQRRRSSRPAIARITVADPRMHGVEVLKEAAERAAQYSQPRVSQRA
ncbi:type II toxin-antitoxin system HicB family antitoxin [Streptomyces sp. NPDC090741]|uniref:type II toxin-antitoxin system HicB family antitoxin n=1 Tax=Streptomyces sp. NPDC090741 TaxID=3365967 RepID=UPI00382D03D6